MDETTDFLTGTTTAKRGIPAIPRAPLELPHAAHQPRSTRLAAPDSRSRPEAREGVEGTDESVDPWDVDLDYLDAVDRASALSFPASDPPALSGPSRGPAAERPRQFEDGGSP